MCGVPYEERATAPHSGANLCLRIPTKALPMDRRIVENDHAPRTRKRVQARRKVHAEEAHDVCRSDAAAWRVHEGEETYIARYTAEHGPGRHNSECADDTRARRECLNERLEGIPGGEDEGRRMSTGYAPQWHTNSFLRVAVLIDAFLDLAAVPGLLVDEHELMQM